MQAHVKMPHIRIDIKGDIPSKLLSLLKEEYGKKVKIIKDKNDELVNITETDWYRKTKSKITPGDVMRTYRENYKLTQLQLGEKLGGISRQHISDMENGRRLISLNIAKKLSKIFKRPVERFLDLD